MVDVRAPATARPAGGRTTDHEVEIREIAAGGAGVGRLPDGRVVFVHGTAPGERVLVELTELRRNWSRGRLRRVLSPGPERRQPPCPHAGRCGGCTLQHMEYAAQQVAKANIVAQALRRIGHFEVAPPIVDASPLEFGYRNRLSLTMMRLGDGRVLAGFHPLAQAGRVVDVPDCLLAERPIRDAWAALRGGWGHNAARLPAGRSLRLTLRASERGDVALLVEGGHGPGRAPELMDRVPNLVAIWHRPGSATRPRILAGAPTVTEVWNREDADIAGGAFLQVNRHAARALEDWVVERAGPVQGKRVIDAYCGIGVHGRRLARLGATVVGIELDPDAVAEARRQAGAPVTWLEGSVESLLPGALPADIVIVNPPRAGLDAAVSESLTRAPPRGLLYVSCDPATLSRDLDRLRTRFRLAAVRCFDLFPQTAHVETVAELVCATS